MTAPGGNFRAVAAVVRDDAVANRPLFLMIRRAAGIAASGYWTPVTGRLEAGEDERAAVVREVREETGLDVVCGELLHRGTTEGAASGWKLAWYEARPAAGSGPGTVLAPLEVAEARWCDLTEISALEPMFPATRRVYAALENRAGNRD